MHHWRLLLWAPVWHRTYIHATSLWYGGPCPAVTHPLPALAFLSTRATSQLFTKGSPFNATIVDESGTIVYEVKTEGRWRFRVKTATMIRKPYAGPSLPRFTVTLGRSFRGAWTLTIARSTRAVRAFYSVKVLIVWTFAIEPIHRQPISGLVTGVAQSCDYCSAGTPERYPSILNLFIFVPPSTNGGRMLPAQALMEDDPDRKSLGDVVVPLVRHFGG